jgi:hypothetical protein
MRFATWIVRAMVDAITIKNTTAVTNSAPFPNMGTRYFKVADKAMNATNGVGRSNA